MPVAISIIAICLLLILSVLIGALIAVVEDKLTKRKYPDDIDESLGKDVDEILTETLQKM